MDNLEQDIINNQVPDTSVGVPSDQFIFQTIAELEVPPEIAEFDSAIDPEYQAMLDEHASLVNRYSMAPVSNYNSPIPGPSTGKYNPVSQSSPPNISTMEGKLRMFNDMSTETPNIPEDGIFGSNTVKIADPIFAGIRESNFDRFYESPQYKNLGWHPYADNESYYNENSSWWDDASRMFGELGALTGTGYLSGYRSWFDGESVMDLQSAVEYEDRIRIGNSTRGGFGGGFNNFLLNSGYTFGIIGSIAVEELAMWGATAAATVLTAPAAGVGGAVVGAAAIARSLTNAQRLAKLGRRIVSSFSLGKLAQGTRAMMMNLNSIQNAKGFYDVVRAGGNVLGKMLVPESMAAFKNLKSAQKAGENVTNMAKATQKLGGFYRDLRSMNFALSEGRMEGGSVYKEQLATNYSIQAQENRKSGLGDDVTPEQMKVLSDDAKKAAFATTLWNVPLIYVSNQLLLGNAFGGFKRSLSQMTRDNIAGIGKRMLKTKATIETVKGGGKKLAKDVFEDVGESFMNLKYLRAKIKAGGVRGGAVMAAGAGLRYFAANVTEGLQEVYQEAVAAGVKDYYTNLAFDPANGNVQQMKASAYSGLGEQMSGQGLEVFMSGFFMGGVVSGPQKLVFQGIPNLYQRTFNNAEYTKYKTQKDDLVAATLKSLNNSWNSQSEDVSNMFDEDTLNFLEQKQAAEAMETAQMEDNTLGFYDSQDDAKFLALHRMFSSGKQDFFKEQLQDYLKLSDVELAEAFPAEAAAAKSGKLRLKIAAQLENINEKEKVYEQNKDEMVSPFDPSAFKEGTKEYKNEQYKEWAFNHARMLYMFTQNGFKRAGERAESIYNELESDPILKEIAANDITVLLNKDTLLTEISQLKAEIPGLGEAGTKLLKKDKEKKLEKLQAIADVLYADENQTLSVKDKRFDRRKMSKLTPKVLDYLKMLAKSKKDFVDESRIEEVLKKIVDHNHLSNRQRVYDKAIQFLNNPEQLDLIVRRSYEYIKFAHKGNLKKQEKIIRAFINKKEINQLLNELMKLDVYVDPEQLMQLSKTGDSNFLTIFYSENGIVNPIDDPKLWNKILSLVDIYRQSAGVQDRIDKEKASAAVNEENINTTASQASTAVDDLLENEGVDAPEVKIYGKLKEESPTLNKILNKLWNNYRGAQSTLREEPIQFDEFVKTAIAKNTITAYVGLKKLWYQTLTNVENNKERMALYNSDSGFLEWLALQETNPIVFKVLDQSNVNIKLFLPDFESKEGETDRETRKKKGKDLEGKNADIIEVATFDKTTEKRVTYYAIRDKAGEEISDDIVEKAGLDVGLSYSTLAKAKAALKIIDPLVPNFQTYEFGGLTLQYGIRIKDIKTGKYYIVLATPADLKYKRIYVLNEELSHLMGDVKKRNKSAEKGKDNRTGLNENEFKARFTIEESNIGSSFLPENASKLRVDEATALVLFERDKYGRNPENETYARRRYQFIIQQLSAEELALLEIEVTVKPNGGKIGKNLKFTSKGEEANPFIKNTTSLYDIAVKMPGALASKINDLLLAADLTPTSNGIIGYIPNNDVILYDRNMNIINPLSIQADQLSDLFNIGRRDSQQAAQDIQNNFAIQLTIMNAIKEKLNGASQGTFTLEDIGGLNFLTTPGSIDFLKNGEVTAIDKLTHNKVNGKTVILKNTRRKGKMFTTILTERGNSTVPELMEFEETMKAEMNAQYIDLFENAKNASRYVMIIKQDNGVYSYAPIKSDVLETEALNNLANTLIERSAETVKENISGNKKKVSTQTSEVEVTSSKNIFTVEPIQAADKKAKTKAKIATQYIGFAEGIAGSSTASYSKQAGQFANTGVYSSDDVIFVSIGGKRGSAALQKSQQDRTIKEAIKAVEAGATIITDNKSYTDSSTYNTGEKKLYANMKAKGYNYSEVTVDGQTLGTWSKSSKPAQQSSEVEVEVDTVEGKVKDLTYNSEFNQNLNNGKVEKDWNGDVILNQAPAFYIASVPGYSFDLNVTSKGGLQIKIYDRDGQQSLSILMNDVARIAEFASLKNKYELLQELFKLAQDQINDAPAKLKKTDSATRKASVKRISKDVKLDINSLRESFAPSAKTSEIVDASVTTISPIIRKDSKMIANIDGVDVQQMYESSLNVGPANTSGTFTPTETFTDAEGNPIPKGPEQTTSNSDATNDPNSVNLISLTAEEFKKLQDKKFSGLTNDQIEFIANKQAEGVGLSNRELQVMGSPVGIKINAKVLQILNSSTKKISPENVKEENTEVNLLAELAKINTEIEVYRLELHKSLPRKEYAKALKNDLGLKKLEAKHRDISNKLSANKVVSKNLTEKEVVAIDEFIEWAKNNLPDFITIEDINNLGNNLKSGGERVGAFVMALTNIAGKETIGGTIYTGTSTRHAYHEAFHAVFRMLLTKEQQDKYYAIAKKEVSVKLKAESKSLKNEIQKLKNSDIEKYRNFSDKALENLYYEEYMADEFEIFKQNPKNTKTSSWIKSLFNKMLEWIRNVLGNYNATELQLLFEEINAGKFKGGKAIFNPFTDSAAGGITLDVSKIIRSKSIYTESGVELSKNLDGQVAKTMVSSITARVLDLELKNTDPNFNIADATIDSIELYRKLYDFDNAQYENNTQLQDDLLIQLGESFEDFETDIYEAVIKQLELYDIKLELFEDETSDDEFEEAFGLRTTGQYDKDASSIGGSRSLPAFLRKYIGTTIVAEKDVFGNEFLDGKEKIMITTDFQVAYSGFLKAASNHSDPVKILQELYLFGRDNPQTNAVVKRLFNDLGLTWEGQLNKGLLPGTTKNNNLFQKVLKGFENAKVDHLFIHRITGNGKNDPNSNTVITYDAANRDDAHYQIEIWEEKWRQLRKVILTQPAVKEKTVKELNSLLLYLSAAVNTGEVKNKSLDEISDEELTKVSKNLAETLESNIGIALSPQYIAYSIATNINKLTPYQASLITSKRNSIPISYEAIEQLKIGIDSNSDIMSSRDEGIKNRLRRLAIGNAVFDERVGASVFRNPNGDLVYAHQKPTLHLKKINGLNDVEGNGAVITNLAETDPYLASNYLVKSKAMKQLSAEGRLKIMRLSGSKTSKNIEKDAQGGILEKYDKNEKGTIYGDYNYQEFMVALLSAYISGVNPKSGAVDDVLPEGANSSIATAPVLIRVIEAASTGDMMKELPIIKAVLKNSSGKSQITKEALNILTDNIETELFRIARELNPDTATYNTITEEGEKVANYNSDENGQVFDINGRAFKFHNTGDILKAKINIGSKNTSSANIQHRIETTSRIIDGTQTMFVMTADGAKNAGFTISEEVKGVLLQATDKIGKGKKAKNKLVGEPVFIPNVRSKGGLKVTGFNEAEIILKFGAAISKNKTESHTTAVQLNEGDPQWVESPAIRDFLLGKKEMHLFEVVSKTEDVASDLDQELENAITDENYDVAAKIRDKISNLSKASFKVRLEELLIENSKLALEDQVKYTLDSALKAIGETKKSLENFIEKRLDQDFLAFEKKIESAFGKDGLPKFISKGLTKNATSTGSKIDFDIANKKLNLTDNKVHNLKQIFLNDLINTTSINEILLGDQAYSLANAVQAVKRAKAQNAAYFSAESKIAAPEMNVKKPVKNISLFAFTEPIGTSMLNDKKNIEEADAQNYMTVKAFRYMRFAFGQLEPTQAKLLDKIEDGAAISIDDIYGTAGAIKKQEMLNSKKLVYADGKIFDKMSMIPLTKDFTSKQNEKGQWVARHDRVKLHNMRVSLEQFEQANDTIAIASPLSALKMMKYNITNVDKFVGSSESIWQSETKGSKNQYMDKEISSNVIELTVDQSMTLDAGFMGLQVLNPSNKMEIVDPTQIKSLITGEQNDSTEVIIDGVESTIGAVRMAYNKATRDRMEGKYLNKRNLIFNFDAVYASDELHKSIKEGKITANLLTYLKAAQASLESQGSASELLEFFSYNEVNGEQIYELNNNITMGKFEQLFMSYFSKGVTSEKIAGTSAALMSDFGVNVYRRVLTVDENGYPDQQEIIRSDDFAKNYSVEDLVMKGEEPIDFSDDLSFDTLKSRVESSKGKGVIILDRLRFDMKEYIDGKFTGQKYTESLFAAHSKEVMRDIDKVSNAKIPDMVAKMFAIRIPSQDNHSAVNIKVVDFLPAYYGSTIISARELVEVSGADFDIDKLYLQMKEYYVDSVDTNEKVKVYDVVVDMYEHKTEVDATGDPVDIWVVDSLNQAQEQLNIIKNSAGKGKNFGEITNVKENEWVILHKRGDHKKIYLRGSQPKLIVKDKLRTKGEPYMKSVKKKVFKEYTDSHEDYVKYVNKKVNKKGSIYAEAAFKATIGIDAPVLYEDFKNSGLTKKSIDALGELKLPRSKAEYEAYIAKNERVPYEAPLSNMILDQKAAMLSHSGVTQSINGNSPISYEAADIEILKEVWAEISEDIPELAEQFNEEGVNANDLNGKWIGYTSNQEGKRGIGAAVLPNLYLSLLQEYDIEIKELKTSEKIFGVKLEFNGKTFDKFSNFTKVINKNGEISYKPTIREILEDGNEGRRKQYIISALITAMTDNAKEKLADKLGLNKNALAVVANMTALGIPIKTSILLIKQPLIKRVYELESLSGDEFFSISDAIKEKIEALIKGVSEFEVDIQASEIEVNNETLIQGIKNETISFDTMSELEAKLINPEVRGEIIPENMNRDIAILTQFLNAHTLAEFTRNLGTIMNLTNGYGKELANFNKINKSIKTLGLDLTDDEYNDLPNKLKPLMDVRKIFKSATWQSKLLEIYGEFSQSLAPKVFLTESSIFKSMYNSMIDNFKSISNDEMAVVKRDLLSYITLKAWSKLSIDAGGIYSETLSNDLIYENDSNINIGDIVIKAREVNGNNYNAFLNDFIVIKQATEEGNRVGITTIGSNTLSSLSDSYKMDIQDGFKSLFLNIETKSYAVSILNYLMVKDGLQPTYQTLLAAISPSMLGKYLSSITHVREAFAREEDSSVLFESIFGMTKNELRQDFIENYSVSSRNVRHLREMTDLKVYNPESQIQVAKSKYTVEQVQSSPNTLFIIFDNDAQNGTDNASSLRNEPNVKSIKFKKNVSNMEDNFYTEAEVDKKIKSITENIEDVQTARLLYDHIMFPLKLDDVDRKALKKNNKKISDHLSTLLKENFGYSFNGVQTKKEKTEEKLNKAALLEPIYINKSKEKAVVIVELTKGYASTPKFLEKTNERILPAPKGNNLILKENINKIKKAGFKNVDVIDKRGVTVKEIIFPSVIRIQGKVFQLIKMAGSLVDDTLISNENSVAIGSYAEYLEVDVMDSPAQNAGAASALPNRRTNASVQAVVAEANPKEDSEDSDNANNNTIVYDYVQGSHPALDVILEKKYNEVKNMASKGGFKGEFDTFEEFILKAGAQYSIKMYMRTIQNTSSNITREANGSVTIGGNNLLNLEEGKSESESEVDGLFTIPGEDETSTQSQTDIKVDDLFVIPEGQDPNQSEDSNLFDNDTSAEAQITDWYENLTIFDQQNLSKNTDGKIKSAEDLIKESKKIKGKSVQEFLDEVKQCFL